MELTMHKCQHSFKQMSVMCQPITEEYGTYQMWMQDDMWDESTVFEANQISIHISVSLFTNKKMQGTVLGFWTLFSSSVWRKTGY